PSSAAEFEQERMARDTRPNLNTLAAPPEGEVNAYRGCSARRASWQTRGRALTWEAERSPAHASPSKRRPWGYSRAIHSAGESRVTAGTTPGGSGSPARSAWSARARGGWPGAGPRPRRRRARGRAPRRGAGQSVLLLRHAV